MKKIFFIILLVNLSCYAQQCEWLEGFNTVGRAEVKVDKNGNTFMLIAYTDSVNEKIPVVSYDSLPRYMLIKRDKHNNFLWSKIISCTGRSRLLITFNKNEEAVLNGYFSKTLSTPDFSLTSNGYEDICVIKIDNGGHFSLLKRLGGPGNERGECVFDSEGSMIVTGGYKYSGTFDTLFYRGNISEDFFLMVYDSSGKIKWSDRAVTADSSIYSYCNGSGLKTDTFNNIYIEISGAGVLESNGMTIGMYYGAYLYKFKSSGTYLNWYDIGFCFQACNNAGYGVDNAGNIYYATTINSTHASYMSSIVKRDSAAHIVWQKQFGIGGYWGPDYWIHGFYLDKKGDYYFSGTGDTTAGTREYISKGEGQTGVIDWTYHAEVDGSYITKDKDDAIYISGTYRKKKTVGGVTITSLDTNYYSPYVVKMTGPTANVFNPALKKQAINIYPIPSSGKFFVDTDEKLISIRIYNSFGEKINCKSDKNEIDLSTQPKGIYFVEIVADEKRTVKKIILE